MSPPEGCHPGRSPLVTPLNAIDGKRESGALTPYLMHTWWQSTHRGRLHPDNTIPNPFTDPKVKITDTFLSSGSHSRYVPWGFRPFLFPLPFFLSPRFSHIEVAAEIQLRDLGSAVGRCLSPNPQQLDYQSKLLEWHSATTAGDSS